MLQVSVFHDMSTVTLIVNEKDAAYVLAKSCEVFQDTWLLHLETFYAVLSDSLCHLADQF